MALIKCPECGKMISDQASNCPECGYPVSKNKECAVEKTFSVFYIDWTNGMQMLNVEVKAKDAEEAKKVALSTLENGGHPNATIAPELPGSGIQVVQEIH